MIFLTVGTWRVGYNRLIKAVDELVSHGVITEEVIAQIGYSSYKPKQMETIEFCPPNEFRELICKARLVISHAGMGTIIEAVHLNKPLIAVPRRRLLGEVGNDHQLNTARHLESEGKILVAYDVSELPAKIEQAKNFIPTKSGSCKEIIQVVKELIDDVAEKQGSKKDNHKHPSKSMMRLWPYRILSRDDEEIKDDIKNIMQHFTAKDKTFDMVIFVPYAGLYLAKLFSQIYKGYYKVNFITARRVSTVTKTKFLKRSIFKRKWLSDFMRHIDVLLRLTKYTLGLRQKMVAETKLDFDVRNKKVLVIDDDVATGTTLEMVKFILLKHGASSITTASISNHFLPDKIKIDYSVYKYKLLRTKNSRDYYAV